MKKTWLVRTILAALLSCGMVFALASCSTNYTVSYSLGEHAADGAAAPESAEYEQGTQITLPEAPAAEDGWEFTAWSDGETTYDAGDSFAVEANVTFTAQWTEVTTPTPETYTVTFDANGGAFADEEETLVLSGLAEDSTIAETQVSTPTRKGYTFGGWYTAETEGTQVTLPVTVTGTATYYAHWTAQTYSVTYVMNGGAEIAAGSYTYGVGMNLPTPATRTGYTFAGWYATSDFSGNAVTSIGTTETGDKTFYAKWTLVTYDITYSGLEGGTHSNPTTYDVEDSDITLTAASRDGYRFDGWYDAQTGGNKVETIDVSEAVDVTLYARWTQLFTVTYAVGANAADGATAPAAVQVADGESVTLPAGDDIPAAATGYHFDGWYVEGTKIEGTTYTPAADVTITATYAANIYTVAFDDNVDDSSVTGTMASQSFTYGTAQNLTDNAFTRTGYTFSGWATSADGTVAYDDEESVNNLTAKNGATVTLYAVWDPIAPTIEWVKTDNVTGSDPSGTIYSWNEENGNYTITLPENTYSCAGSVFNGWVVVVNESSNSYQPGKTFTVAPGTKVTISPVWKVTSTITFAPNGATGGTVPDAITGKVSGDTIDLPGNTGNLVRTGYTFVGWSETQDGNAIEGQYTVEGNVTLYAVWTANTYTVTLNYNYENAPADVTITVTFGSTFGAGTNWPTTDPVRDGFTFMGWWTANDGTGTQYTGATQVTTEAANLTLYAHWSATAVSVTFDYNDGTDSTEHDQIVSVEVNGTITAEDVDDPTRTGYRFEGWYTEADGGTKVEFPITNVTEPATYYAHWTQVWTVSVDGATVATLAEGKTYELGTPDARDGFTFMGWAVDGEIAYTTTDNTVTMGTENIVLTTVWADHSKISTEAELLAVLADATADEITLADNIEMTTSGIDIRRDFSINLNEKTITFTTSATAAAADRIRLTAYGTSYSDRIEVAITNGALGFNTNGNTNIDGSASMIFTQNVDLTMNGVTVTSDAMGLFIACGKLNMTDCTVTAVGAYAIGTNASISEGSELYGPVDMTISGSTLTAEFNGGAGLLFNVAGSLTLTNTSVTGGRQGVIIRSGTATITGGSITSAWTDPDTDSYIDSWGSGTAVPMAALVIGDISAGVYKNNTSVTISGTQVTVTGTPESARYIYIAGDATDGTKATLTYACNDEYMTALADTTNGIIVANDSASVVVTHSETLTYVEEQEATCTEDGHAAYYQCSICEKYFDAEHNETTLEELKTADKLGHEYNALVYDSKTGVVSISCARNDLTISATVTISGGDATGTLVLAAENFVFNQDTQTFTLTLPANAYDAPTGKYFGGWLVAVANGGDDVYQPNATVTVANGATITITAHWLDYSAEHPLEIGTPDNTLVYTGDIPIWEGTISQGETVTFTGTMTSAAANSWQTVLPYMWSTTNDGQFRFDNYINKGLDDYPSREGWNVFYNVIPNAQTVLGTIRNCNITVTYDWSNDAIIYLTIHAAGNNDPATTDIMTYKIVPVGDSFGVTRYNIGLGGQESYTVINSITVTQHTHSYTDSVCTACSQIDPEHEHTFTNGVCSVCHTACEHGAIENGTCTECGGTVAQVSASNVTPATWGATTPYLVAGSNSIVITGQYADAGTLVFQGIVLQIRAMSGDVLYFIRPSGDYASSTALVWNNPCGGMTMTAPGYIALDQESAYIAAKKTARTRITITLDDAADTLTVVYELLGDGDAATNTMTWTMGGMTDSCYEVGVALDGATLTSDGATITSQTIEYAS